ncbi:hypothetical protein ABMY26_19310 [Azospirillum sp. HJ39]|uniref:hypothetical protein n=1 Tax=Azospirillum sp. HJ39 TaxID=3159496 RepID=UPI003556E5F8
MDAPGNPVRFAENAGKSRFMTIRQSSASHFAANRHMTRPLFSCKVIEVIGTVMGLVIVTARRPGIESER